MKRDWDVIRELLLRVEQCTVPGDQFQIDVFPTERHAEVSYHMQLLIDAGLVEGDMLRTLDRGPRLFIAQRLSWAGHDLLETMRSNTVWDRIKKKAADEGIELSFEAVKMIGKWVLGAMFAVGGGSV